jgi:hypothetical protein
MNFAEQLSPGNISNMIRELGGSKNRTVPYESFSTERLKDILIHHNCTVEQTNDCTCLIIDDILDKRLIK